MKKGSLKVPVFGLTGGIASGKSTAARIFSELGLPVLDADQISKKISAPGGVASAQIEKRFETTDRSKLREIIFSDPQAQKDLEGILHPLIREKSSRDMKQLARLGKPIIYEATLIIETGRHNEFDGLIVISSSFEKRVERLMTRDHCSKESAEKIIQSQNARLSEEDRKKYATHWVENDGSPEELKKKILSLIPILYKG